jgi:hypothetical protein
MSYQGGTGSGHSAEFSMVNSFGFLVMTVSSFQCGRRCGLMRLRVRTRGADRTAVFV